MFLDNVARYDIKDMWELFMDLWSNINRGCFTILKWAEYSFYWKRNIWHEEKCGLEGMGQGKIFGKVLRIMVHLSKERKYAQVSSPKSCFKSNQLANLKINQKSKSGKIQGVTNLPPLEKSRPRDLVAQGTIGNIPYSGILLSLGFPLYCIVFPR